MLAFDGLFFAVAILVGDFPSSRNSCLTPQIVDLVLFKKELDAPGKFVRHRTAPGNNFRPIVGKFVKAESEVGGALLHELKKFRVAQQRFGWNAAPVQTGPTSSFFFYTGYLFAELSRANGTDIAGRPTAYNDQIVFHKTVIWDTRPSAIHSTIVE